ncbi:hypothetical protein [Serratia sp. (in: enterobacteria)]|uniref:hypothetical protein n=1 Tax=Serratia sp. (in: enterobacteria) TaxID=616 RepID=UPI003989FCA5
MGRFGRRGFTRRMTTRFAVNIIGYIDDSLDKYTAEQLEKMLSVESVTHCFEPLKTVAVICKKIPADSVSIDAGKVKKHYKVKLSEGGK